jgi:hypothetical protein
MDSIPGFASNVVRGFGDVDGVDGSVWASAQSPEMTSRNAENNSRFPTISATLKTTSNTTSTVISRRSTIDPFCAVIHTLLDFLCSVHH